MIKPRNSLVVLKLHETRDKQVGAITVPTNNDLYTEAEVIAVGPGTIQAAGGVSETGDLSQGQRVYVKHKERTRDTSKVGGLGTVYAGLEYRDGDQTYLVVEQSSVVFIIAEPAGTFPRAVITN